MNENEKKLLEQKVEFVPWVKGTEFVYSREGVMGGIQLPDGNILLNMAEHTSGATMALYKKQLDAVSITVHGKWVFVPDPETLKIYER